MCTLEHCKQKKIYRKNCADENLVLFKYNFNFDLISKKFIVDTIRWYKCVLTTREIEQLLE